jgi:hypothetical protein
LGGHFDLDLKRFDDRPYFIPAHLRKRKRHRMIPVPALQHVLDDWRSD